MSSFSTLALSAALALASACAGSVNAGEFWMDGVSRDSGWYDINKTWGKHDSDGKYSNYDTNYCWAAAGSNILSWWQDQLPSSLKDLPDIPTGENIYNTIRLKAQAFSGGLSIGAWQWFLHGDTTEYLPGLGGEYYQSHIPESYLTEGTTNSLYVTNLWSEGSGTLPISSFRSRLQTAMKDEHCGITLRVNLPSSGSNHAITLWGAEYDDATDKITKLFITDSDDTQDSKDYTVRSLVTLGCVYYTDSNYIYLYDIDEEGNTISGTYTDGHASIFGVHGLKAYTVPEPVSAAFLFLGLGTVLTRRRR